jgi:hypothetical protein
MMLLLCTQGDAHQETQDHKIIAWCTQATYANTTTPTTQALRQPRHAPRVLVSRPQRLYIDYTVRRRDIVFWVYDYFDYYLD